MLRRCLTLAVVLMMAWPAPGLSVDPRTLRDLQDRDRNREYEQRRPQPEPRRPASRFDPTGAAIAINAKTGDITLWTKATTAAQAKRLAGTECARISGAACNVMSVDDRRCLSLGYAKQARRYNIQWGFTRGQARLAVLWACRQQYGEECALLASICPHDPI